MRLGITHLSATGFNSGGVSYLPEAVEYFARASVTDAAAKEDINQFIIGCKQLGIWDKLVFVPCLSAYGGLHQLGGASQRTNTPWTLVNASLTTLGVSMTLNGDNNHMLSDQVYNTASTPWTSGSFTYQNQTPNTVIQNNFTQKVVGQTWRFDGMAAAGAVPFWHTHWGHGILLSPANQPLNNEQVNNSYRNAHLSAVSVDGTANYWVLTDNNIRAYAHTGPITPFVQKMRFYAPAGTGQAGVIQGAFLYYDRLSTLGNAVWSKFRALVNQTMLSRLTTAGNRRILISGQSNGVNQNLSIEFSRQSVGELMGPTELFRSGVGGVPISAWIGAAGSNARTAQYRTDFWDGTSSGPPFQSSRITGVGRRAEYLIWFQGESDTELASTAAAYRSQLATLINYFRADTGNPELKVIVVQIDYNFTLRDDNVGGFFSDLTLTGFAGGLSALNGSYAITPLTGHFDPYVWTKTGYRVEQQSNRWVFVETAGSTVVASAVQTNLPHPAMVTNWVDASTTAITPSFGAGNRTEWIERIRYAQREIVNDLPNVFTFDSRGYTRTDGVHIDNAAHIPFTIALGDYLRTI